MVKSNSVIADVAQVERENIRRLPRGYVDNLSASTNLKTVVLASHSHIGIAESKPNSS